MKRNVTFVISNINKSIAFEWIASSINYEKFNLNFILMNPGRSELEDYLKEKNIPIYRLSYTGKKNILKSIFLIYKFLKKNKTNIVHTHLFDANIAGLFAAWLARVPKRIHTRHHSDYHHVYYPKAIKYDKFVNQLSTDIVAISKVVEEILITKEKVSPKKVHLIHHGFKLQEYHSPPQLGIDELKKKYISRVAFPIVGVISRYTEWKGIQYIIPAFEKLLEKYPEALLILANASGEFKPEIQSMLSRIPKKNYLEISFESDIFSLYKLFDLFIHVPISPEAEAFGQTYIECLAAGVPLIATNSGIAHEVLVDKYNSLIVPYKNSDVIYDSMMSILVDENLKQLLVSNSYSSVSEKFEFQVMLNKLENLYLQ